MEESYVQLLEEVLAKKGGAVKFFGKTDFTFAQKEQAEEAFLDALKKIESGDGNQAKKASHLLKTFDKHINSPPVQRFWEAVRLQNEKAATRHAQRILAEKKLGKSSFDVLFDEYVDATSTDGGSRKAAVTSSKREVASIDDDSRQSQDSVSEASESDNISEYVPSFPYFSSDATSDDNDDEKLLQLLPVFCRVARWNGQLQEMDPVFRDMRGRQTFFYRKSVIL
ncbi:hypothetical protein BC938DRAFT_482369 [Jimgerdemannia flammicorona]|uniref:Uncharacterized protein n=1 Tax=Jimgerdemannia flammicorona TaxID=994334 RepID=A0A433QEC0_9FUNG|nr:hypothetical protein BC938DRAFT_482369 [Jimgerdemannia flammicorona]